MPNCPVVGDTSLLTCLGPREARTVAPQCQAGRQSAGNLPEHQVLGNHSFQALPMASLQGPGQVFSSMKQPPESSKENSGMLFLDCVPVTKVTLERFHLFSQRGFCGQINLGNPSPGFLVVLQCALAS